MKKILKIFMVLGIIFLGLYFTIQIFGGLYIGGFFNPPITEQDMIGLFAKDKQILIESANALIGKDDIYLILTDDANKEELTGIYKQLSNNGYEIIFKNDDYVAYQKWSNIDEGRGFVYSYNDTLPSLQFLTKLIPLKEGQERAYRDVPKIAHFTDDVKYQHAKTGTSPPILYAPALVPVF